MNGNSEGVNHNLSGIADLDIRVKALSREDRKLFRRIFHMSAGEGQLEPPDSMLPWIEKQFGSIDATKKQKIVKVTNLVTFEGALFNRLRASRPIETREKLMIEARIIDHSFDDPLRRPMDSTPADTFGRVKGKFTVTASNIAKYDAYHGIIIFDDYNPLHFDKEEIIDYLDTGWEWAKKAHDADPSAKYYFFLWNCLRRAGASLLHGHAQVTLSRGMHYAKIEGLRRAALRYRSRYKSDYFDDLFSVHQSLGLAVEMDGVRLMAYLTPVKEKEIMIMSDKYDTPFKEYIYHALACLRDSMNVTNFNMALFVPPPWKVRENWSGFPIIARMVDRGDQKSGSCDIGTMELYAACVISSDPYEVVRLLKQCRLVLPEETEGQPAPAAEK
ncbi:MAG: hypothetical protein U1D67_07115 [Dehalococcoidia bacterium]|nr:hypothetical protein [Dehalococcoidia bacterium]MDZ4246871.1 hypothetical protein [Dehalococcoidia bacterium]